MSDLTKCGKRLERADGSWLPCELPEGHGIVNGMGCSVSYRGEEPVWNPRDRERRKGERRSALAGETFPDDAARESEFVECEQDSFGWDGYHTEDAVAHARMFRRQRDALLLQLQDKEERIKTLEGAGNAAVDGIEESRRLVVQRYPSGRGDVSPLGSPSYEQRATMAAILRSTEALRHALGRIYDGDKLPEAP